MKIIRLGSTHGSPSRYVDLYQNKDVEKVLWLSKENDLMVSKVFDVCEEIEPNFSLKMKLFKFSLPKIVGYIGSFFNRVSERHPGLSKFTPFINYFFIWLLKMGNFGPIRKEIEVGNYDFVWSGNNDSDGINILLWWFKVNYPEIQVIHSYQEHRCRFRLDEKMALSYADVLVLPSERNRSAFEKIYGLDLAGKTIYANEDWRYSGLIEYVANLDVSKKSINDGEPHVIILSRYATYHSDKDRRRGSRINYIDLIETLVSKNVHVHLNALKIIRSIEDLICDDNNPYFKLRDEYPAYFHIETPLNLDDLDAYSELKSFDAGVLHNVLPGEEINLFSTMNVPNRLFEYLMCDIEPILIKGEMLDAEDLLDSLGLGVVVDSYEDAAKVLHGGIAGIEDKRDKFLKAKKYSFENYTSKILKRAKQEFFS